MRQKTSYALAVLALLPLLPGRGAWGAQAAEKRPVPPADARWTLSCRTFEGPMRIDEAKRAREAMVKQTGDRNWYVVHAEHDSTLFFGFYRSTDLQAPENADRTDAERAHGDRKRLSALRSAQDTPLFPGCLLVPLDAPGEDGPPEWNIQNAPKEAHWTLLIGVYRDDPTRRKAAVDAVRLLRSQGHDAFCLHGQFQSFVYVGQWPATAVAVEEADSSRIKAKENEEIVMFDRPVDPRTETTFTNKEGKIVHLVAPRLTIRDASVRDVMTKFPNFHTNGEVMGKRVKDPRGGAERVEYEASTLSAIPRREASILSAGVIQAPPAIRTISPTGQQPPRGTGRLRSLDDK